MSDRGERVGVNEALFREVNERIEDLQEQLGARRESFEIVVRVAATMLRRYAATIGRFAVVPGHELPEIERTVERHEGYLVVEKTDPEAAEAAEKLA